MSAQTSQPGSASGGDLPVRGRAPSRGRNLGAKALRWAGIAGTLLGLLAVWEAAVWLLELPSYLLPAPTAIVAAGIENAGMLAENALVTLQEVVLGFALGVALGVTLALGIVSSPTFERIAYPVLVTFQTIPVIVMAPIFVLWFGFGLMPKVLVAGLICFFVMVVNTVVGMRGVEPVTLHVVRSMGASGWQTFRKVRLPAALPSIFGGLKVAITQALIGAIVGEYIAAERGLGVVQLRANEFLNITLQFAAVAVIALLGIGLFALMLLLERIVVPWRKVIEDQSKAGGA